MLTSCGDDLGLPLPSALSSACRGGMNSLITGEQWEGS